MSIIITYYRHIYYHIFAFISITNLLYFLIQVYFFEEGKNMGIITSILERLPESLVLLRRKLCWHTKDLLHIRIHQTNSGSQAKNLSDNLATFHKQWDSLDYMLYDFFLKRHEREVTDGGSKLICGLLCYL